MMLFGIGLSEKGGVSQDVHFPGRTRMRSSIMQKLAFLYKPYALAVVSVGYVLGELGHYLIGRSFLHDVPNSIF